MPRPALHQAVSADSEITLVVPVARGEADGGEQWPGPCRGRQRLTQPLKRRRMPGAKPRPLDPPHVPWCPGTERDDTFKDGPPRVRRHHSRGAAVGSEDWSRLPRRRQRERSTPPKLSNHRHGYGEHLRAEHLRAREEKEEPWSDGSD